MANVKAQKKPLKTSVPTKNTKTKTTAPPSTGMFAWLALLTLCVSLLFSRSTLDPVVAIRNFTLCLFVPAFVLYFYIFKKTSLPYSVPPLINIILAAGLIFCLWNGITMFQGINVKESSFETSRTVTNLLLIALVMLAVHHDRAGLSLLCKTLTLLGIVHSFVGIFQYYELAFTDLPGRYLPYGLMANRNLFGSAQVLLVPFAVYTLVAGNKTWKTLSILSLTGLITSVILSQTRAAWLAAGVVVAVSSILVFVFTPGYRKKWLLGSVAGVAAIGLIAALLYATDQKGLAQSLSERVATIAEPVANSSDTTVAAATANERIAIWKKTLQLIGQYPLTGVGPGNWKIGIQAYGNAGLINEEGKYIMDHPHNIYLLVASETGIAGLVLFLGFYLLIGVAGILAIRKTADTPTKILLILMLAGLAGFATDGFFSFPTERIEHTYYLTLMAGILLGGYLLAFAAKRPGVLSLRPWALGSLAVSLFILAVGKARMDFDRHFYRVKGLNKENRHQEVLAEVKRGKSAFAAVDMLGDPLEMYSGLAYKDTKQYEQSLTELNTALRYHPYSARIYNTIGTVYTESRQFDKATSWYLKALELVPRYDIVLKNLAINYYNLGQYEQCLATLKKIDISNEPVLQQVQAMASKRIGLTGSEQ